eukprot:204943_1
MSDNVQKKEGAEANVPFPPKPFYIANMLLPICVPYLLPVYNFRFFNGFAKYLPNFPDTFGVEKNIIYRVIFGIGLIGISSWFQKSAKKEMAKLNIPRHHGNKVSDLATNGVFGISRNPIYMAGAGIIFGCSLLFDNISFIAAYIPLHIYMQFVVIPSEENALKKHFGQKYIQYCNNVPRWLLGNWL